MSDELKKLEALHDMTATEGWKYLLEEVEQRIEILDSIGGVHNIETLYHSKGQLIELTGLLNLRQVVSDQIDDFASNGDNEDFMD